ncbi:unnamed protein product [Phyllotreta striolata]|uniref:Uncharacterized protein n=1 Tax=Phyllotreta striolata TaxID=444603 RepID=A0A9N9XLJ4_PHYSR|nr:unnamed protein product [Phyllotreta striolata]
MSNARVDNSFLGKIQKWGNLLGVVSNDIDGKFEWARKIYSVLLGISLSLLGFSGRWRTNWFDFLVYDLSRIFFALFAVSLVILPLFFREKLRLFASTLREMENISDGNCGGNWVVFFAICGCYVSSYLLVFARLSIEIDVNLPIVVLKILFAMYLCTFAAIFWSIAVIYFAIILQSHLTLSVRVNVNDKYLNPDEDDDDDIRKRPHSGCNPHRSDPAGRTFFDLFFLNNEYNINYGGGGCGGGGGGGYYPTNQYHKPPFGGHNKPVYNKPHHHKPGGAHHKPPGFGGLFGGQNTPFQFQSNQNQPRQNAPIVPPPVLANPGYPSEEIKPVHEDYDYDPITDPYKLRSKGARIPYERRNVAKKNSEDQKNNVRFT